MCRSHHTQIYYQMVIECLLCDVELGNDVTVALCLDDRLMVHHCHRGTVISRLCTTAESNMMALHETCAFYGLVKVCIVAHVDIRHSQPCGSLPESSGIGHLQAFIHLLKADIAVVAYMEFLIFSFLRRYFDDTGSTS